MPARNRAARSGVPPVTATGCGPGEGWFQAAWPGRRVGLRRSSTQFLEYTLTLGWGNLLQRDGTTYYAWHDAPATARPSRSRTARRQTSPIAKPFLVRPGAYISVWDFSTCAAPRRATTQDDPLKPLLPLAHDLHNQSVRIQCGHGQCLHSCSAAKPRAQISGIAGAIKARGAPSNFDADRDAWLRMCRVRQPTRRSSDHPASATSTQPESLATTVTYSAAFNATLTSGHSYGSGPLRRPVRLAHRHLPYFGNITAPTLMTRPCTASRPPLQTAATAPLSAMLKRAVDTRLGSPADKLSAMAAEIAAPTRNEPSLFRSGTSRPSALPTTRCKHLPQDHGPWHQLGVAMTSMHGQRKLHFIAKDSRAMPCSQHNPENQVAVDDGRCQMPISRSSRVRLGAPDGALTRTASCARRGGRRPVPKPLCHDVRLLGILSWPIAQRTNQQPSKASREAFRRTSSCAGGANGTSRVLDNVFLAGNDGSVATGPATVYVNCKAHTGFR